MSRRGPDRPTRRFLWERLLNLTEESSVDLDVIAENFAISGGLIRGAAIRANAWASGATEALTTAHVLASLARELEKNNRSTNEVYIKEYREQVERLLEGRVTYVIDREGVVRLAFSSSLRMEAHVFEALAEIRRLAPRAA